MQTLQSFTLAFLFLASAVPSNAQEGAAESRVVVREGAPLTVECSLRVEQRAEWRRDGGSVPDDMRAGETAAGGRVTARLQVAAAHPHHAGLYSCGHEPSQRVRVVVQPAPALAPSGAAPVTTSTPAAESLPVVMHVPELVKFELNQKFSLNCTLLKSENADDIYWKKNGTEVSEIWDLAGRYELKENVFQMIARSNEDDFGNYTCHKRNVDSVAGEWEVHMKTHAKLPANTNVVEGQKLKLQCKLIGKPYPPVTWTYSNASDGANATDVTIALAGRVKLQATEQGVEGGELVVDTAERTDAGVYTCTPRDGVPDSTTLRVKDMYAALWPFLGICIEVFILCAIILVYEKRRTKPELDDSDTDNHDQKKS